MMNAERCGLCRYYLAADGGLCRRFPPRPHLQPVPTTPGMGNRMQIVAFFPPMRADTGWCGEFTEINSSKLN